MKNCLDYGFEIIATGMEMIDAILEAHDSLQDTEQQDEPKTDHPATFADNLREIEERNRGSEDFEF
jgi:hypothetical protein